jgi:uncharacterized membrane protein YphA (DoxX/SURF4 family)
MKKTKILYWIFTSLFAFMMFGSALPDIVSSAVAIEGFKQMNMPAYLLPFLGIAKALGVFAILVPGFPRIKEWAYAGLMFDLLGATYSIIASGHPAANWAPMALPLLLGAASYIYYHKKLKLTADKASVKSPVRYKGDEGIFSDAGLA